MNLSEEIKKEKLNYFIKANGGISLPFAGFIYWIIVGFLGFILEPQQWARITLFSSGLIFPLGLANWLMWE